MVHSLGWEPSSEEFGQIEDTMAVFLECLLDQVKAEFWSSEYAQNEEKGVMVVSHISLI